MSKLIFLNGAINCGKTTIGKQIAEKCDNVAFVEIDDLHGFIYWMPIEQAVPLNIKNGIAISKNFIKENIDVIFSYPLSDKDFEYVNKLIDFECQTEYITLYCQLYENIKNRGKRELSEYEISRIKWMHENGLAKPNFSTIIDTTDKSINEVVEYLISKLELKRKNVNERI